MAAIQEPSSLVLYDSPHSPCTGRVVIACALKGIPLERRIVDLGVHADSDQHQPDFLRLNPNGLIPVLIVTFPNTTTPPLTITQSVSILEFLEEAYPTRRSLLPPPSSPSARFHIRDLVLTLCADLQPPTNMRIQLLIKELGGNHNEYRRRVFERVLDGFEQAIRDSKGRFCVGDEVSLADVCLERMIWQLEKYPAERGWREKGRWEGIADVVGHCREMDEFNI